MADMKSPAKMSDVLADALLPKAADKPLPKPKKKEIKLAYPLNEMQQAFCRYYLQNDGALTKSAIQAGYSERTGAIQACRLLKLPKIQAELARLRKVAVDRAQKTTDEIIKEMEILGFSDISDFLDVDCGVVILKNLKDIDPVKRRAIKSVKQSATPNGMNIEFVLHDKLKSLEVLGGWHGLGAENNPKGNVVNNNVAYFVVPGFKKQDGKEAVEAPHTVISAGKNHNGLNNNGLSVNGNGTK